MALTVHFEVLNQLGTPMMHSATLANRPAAGIAGRIFFRTDSPFGIFRDTGSAWDQISGASTFSGSLAAGQVAFGSATNTISGTNNLFWDSANNRLGIGTNAPTQSLSLIGNATFSGYVNVGNGTISAPSINFNSSINSGIFYDTTNGGSINLSLSGITLAKINNAPSITTNGQGNTFLGYNAGKVNFSTSTNAYNNTMIGGESGISNTSGFQNTFVGSRSGFQNTTGTQNTFIGQGAGYENTTGSANVMVGFHSGLNFNNTSSAGNTFIGQGSAQGIAGSNGSSNVVVGHVAAYLLNSGTYNCIIGRNSMYEISSGTDNVAIGGISGFSNTTGSRNIYIGKQSGYTATPANANVSGSDNVYIGYNTGASTSTQLNNSIAIGSGVIVPSSNTAWYGNNQILTHIFQSGSVGIKTTSPYAPSTFSLDVNGGLLVKNTAGTTAQLTIINADPSLGGNNGFLVNTVGGTSGSSYVDLQGYYGTSITGSTAIRLNPAGGPVIINSTTNSGEQVQITGSLRVNGQLSPTMGTPSGQHLIINCDGTLYKINLFNP